MVEEDEDVDDLNQESMFDDALSCLSRVFVSSEMR